jgi:ribosome maturation factor RimP
MSLEDEALSGKASMPEAGGLCEVWAMRTVEESIEKLAEALLGEQGLELVDIELERRGGRLWVRLFIDRKQTIGGGITVDECGDFNLAFSQLLDVEELIPESYTLEVSSPGLDRRIRKLKDFIKYMGRTLRVVLNKPAQGRKKITGRLVEADEQGVTLEVDKERLKISHSSIKRANLEYRFDRENENSRAFS